MKPTPIANIFKAPEAYSSVTVQGWIRTCREGKSVAFAELNDGSCFMNAQIVLDKSKDLPHLATGMAVTVEAMVKQTAGAAQPFELQAQSLLIEGANDTDYPLQKKRHSLEYLRTLPHLRARTNTYGAVFRLRSLLAYSIHSFFMERGFLYLHSPILTASDAEGAGAMFTATSLDIDNPPRTDDGKVAFGEDLFGKHASLSVSGQLNAEAFALAYSKVYTFGPTFRAENSNTARHAAEFWMIEPEIAFADLTDDMELAEAMIRYIIADMLDKAAPELAFFDKFIEEGLIQKLEDCISEPFARITYTEAVERLIASGEPFQFNPYWGCDLQTEHERYLTEQVFHKPVFVTDYPKDIKAFYMRMNDDGKTVAAMDLLVPSVGEIIGGSQREERMDILKRRMRELSMDPESYDWYLDLRRFGSVRHAGFGLGFERMLMYMSGIKNIRDVLPFPRTPGLIDC